MQGVQAGAASTHGVCARGVHGVCGPLQVVVEPPHLWLAVLRRRVLQEGDAERGRGGPGMLVAHGKLGHTGARSLGLNEATYDRCLDVVVRLIDEFLHPRLPSCRVALECTSRGPRRDILYCKERLSSVFCIRRLYVNVLHMGNTSTSQTLPLGQIWFARRFMHSSANAKNLSSVGDGL